MTNPFNDYEYFQKAKWLSIYGASFALQMRDRLRDGLELTDEAVESCRQEAKAVADWEQENDAP